MLSGSAPTSKTLRPLVNTSSTTAGSQILREVVGAQQPLVVQHHRGAGPRRNLSAAGVEAGSLSTTRLWKRIIARWCWATARFSSLRRSGISALRRLAAEPVADPRQVEAVHRLVRQALGGPAHLEVQPVGLVELRRLRVERPGAVHRVEVERRRPALEQVGRRHRVAERDRGRVEGQVVVHELAEVGVAGRDLAVADRGVGHRPADLLADLGAQPPALAGPCRENRNGGAGAAAAVVRAAVDGRPPGAPPRGRHPRPGPLPR